MGGSVSDGIVTVRGLPLKQGLVVRGSARVLMLPNPDGQTDWARRFSGAHTVTSKENERVSVTVEYRTCAASPVASRRSI